MNITVVKRYKRYRVAVNEHIHDECVCKSNPDHHCSRVQYVRGKLDVLSSKGQTLLLQVV